MGDAENRVAVSFQKSQQRIQSDTFIAVNESVIFYQQEE